MITGKGPSNAPAEAGAPWAWARSCGTRDPGCFRMSPPFFSASLRSRKVAGNFRNSACGLWGEELGRWQTPCMLFVSFSTFVDPLPPEHADIGFYWTFFVTPGIVSQSLQLPFGWTTALANTATFKAPSKVKGEKNKAITCELCPACRETGARAARPASPAGT